VNFADDDEPQSFMPRLAGFLSLRRDRDERLQRIYDKYDPETGDPLHDQPAVWKGTRRDGIKPTRQSRDLKLEWMKDILPRLTAGGTLVKGLLDDGAMSVVYAASNTGKTFFALDLAYHIATGEKWRGHKIKKQGVVLYIAAEGGHGIANRLAALKVHHGLAMDEGVSLAVIRSPVDLLDPDADAPRLVEIIREVEAMYGAPVVMVVVDTLSRSLAGGDENGAKDMTGFVANIDTIRHEVKAHVMVIHHTGKDAAKGARGHNSLLAATDTEICLVLKGPGKRCVATVTKQRDMPGDEQFPFDLLSVELGADDDGDAVTSAVVVHLDDEPSATHGDSVAEAILATSRHKAMLAKGRAVLDAVGTEAEASETDDGPGTRVAKVGDWRAGMMEGVPEDQQDAKRKEFDRNLKELVAGDKVLTAGERKDRVFWFPLPD
jgi:AAA domain